ncbi:Aste57867_22783 [Aphanomyces stellatus]|uniref:Aste57867_22783 protein n=1 Tax=Aphanomyces stellatus TaxID=120398 RepID=A0A485LLQ2_9STRA|nr:hypothetical protein As57867_022713 [Aphanomyces stellatus]VFT99436.1 Aste57867_22783 [Aphanomyces stellatus]
MVERPNFFTVQPTSPVKMAVLNSSPHRPTAPARSDIKSRQRRSGLDVLLTKDLLVKFAHRRGKTHRRILAAKAKVPLQPMHEPKNNTGDAPPTVHRHGSNNAVTMALPLNESRKNSALLDLLMKPVMQVSSIEKPVLASPPVFMPQSFLDDNPTPKDLLGSAELDPSTVPLPALPALELPAGLTQFPSYAVPVDVDEMARAPPKLSVLNHQKRHQNKDTGGGGSSGGSGGAIMSPEETMDEIDKKRAEMQLPPLSAGESDEQTEIKLLKKFVNRSRLLKKYLNPAAMSREMADGGGGGGDDDGRPRRDSLFHVMDNPAAIRNASDGLDMPRTPPLGTNLHRFAGDGTLRPGMVEDPNESMSASQRVISLEARYKDVHNLRRDAAAEQTETQRNSTNLFQRFCHYFVAKQRVKVMLRSTLNVITEIDSPDTGVDGQKLKKKAPVARRQQDRESAKMFLTGVDALLTLDEIYDEAVLAEKNRNWRRATMLASACISIEKDWTEPLLLRARLCRRLGLWTQALKDLTAALKLNPNNQRLLLQRAHVHTQMQDFHSAIVDLSHVLNQQPNSAEALLLRSKVYAKQNHVSMALKDLSAIIKTDPRNWRAYYERAYMRHKLIEGVGDDSATTPKDKHTTTEDTSLGNIPTLIVHAIEDYFNAIRTGCALNDVIETIGDLAIRLVEWTHDAKHCLQIISGFTALIGLMEDAEAKLKDQRRLAGDLEAFHDPEEDRIARVLAYLLTQRGRLQILIGQSAKASADLDRAVVMDYHYAPAHFYRGAVASMTASDEASRKVVLQHLNRSIHLDPTITGAYIVRGGVYCGELRFNNALQDFKAAVTVDPTLDEIWIQIAIVFLTHYHDCEASAKACTRALKNDLGLTQALHLRGEALARQGNLKAALRDFVRLVMMRPTDRFAHLMKGKLLLQLDHARPALYSYMLFMEMGSNERVLSKHSQAVQEFKLAVDADPTSENLCLLSESLHSMGDTEASLHVINLAISSDPLNAKSYVRRAQCYIGSHAYKTAILDYDYAITLAEKSELYRMYYERALCRSQLLNKAWNQLYSMQRGERVPCYFENNFRPGTPLPVTLPAHEMNAVNMTAFIKLVYVETVNDFAKCMKASENMADPYVERAALYVLGGEYTAAYADLAKAIEIDPKNLHAHISAGVLHCRFSQYTASIQNYDKALRHHPNSALAYYNRGVSYHTLQIWAQADADYTKSIELDPLNMDALRNRGIARCHLSNFQGAAADFEEVHKSAPDDMELYMGLGYVFLKLNRFSEAIALFKSSSSNNPMAIDAFLDAGNTFFTMAKYISESGNTSNASNLSQSSKSDTFKSLLQQALHCYLRATRINPTDVNLRLNLAALFRARKDDTNANRQYHVVLALDSKNQEYHDEKAMMLFEKGQYVDAIQHMNAAIDISVSLSPIVEMEFALLIRNKAMALDELNRRHRSHLLRQKCSQTSRATSSRDLKRRMSDAVTTVDKKSIMDIKKSLALHLANRGKVFEQMGRIDEAREDYTNAAYFDPLSYEVYFHLGTLSLFEQKLDECVDYLAHALVLHPKLGVAQLNWGIACLLQGSLDAAMQHFDAAADLIPDCAFVYANRACVHLKRRAVDEALTNYSQAMRCLPTFAPFYVYRGRLLSGQKHLHDAMVDFAAALKMGYKDTL